MGSSGVWVPVGISALATATRRGAEATPFTRYDDATPTRCREEGATDCQAQTAGGSRCVVARQRSSSARRVRARRPLVVAWEYGFHRFVFHASPRKHERRCAAPHPPRVPSTRRNGSAAGWVGALMSSLRRACGPWGRRSSARRGGRRSGGGFEGGHRPSPSIATECPRPSGDRALAKKLVLGGIGGYIGRSSASVIILWAATTAAAEELASDQPGVSSGTSRTRRHSPCTTRASTRRRGGALLERRVPGAAVRRADAADEVGAHGAPLPRLRRRVRRTTTACGSDLRTSSRANASNANRGERTRKKPVTDTEAKGGGGRVSGERRTSVAT